MKVFFTHIFSKISYNIYKKTDCFLGEMPDIIQSKGERDGSLSLLGDNKLP